MGKIAFLFPGQGCQYVGMGKDLYLNSPQAREVFDLADSRLGYELSSLCFNGSEQDLTQTENTQPAILTVSVAAYRALAACGVRAELMAGLSLGEYSALVCSGMLEFAEAVTLVRKRGLYMQQAVPEGVGGMAAVLGLETEKVEQACEQARTFGLIQIANYNCPGQIVISGEKKALEAAAANAVALGARRVIPLQVSGPFHTSLLQPAAEKLAQELKAVNLKEPEVAVISNVTAEIIPDPVTALQLLPQQVKSPVLWEMTIRKMLAAGVDTFVEIGPGSTLRGFVKKIDRQANLLNVEDMASLANTVEFFRNNS